MTNESKSQTSTATKGYQPKPETVEGGYRPAASGAVNPTDLKPPSGGTAIEPPNSEIAEKPKQ